MIPTPTQVKKGRTKAKLTQDEIGGKFGLTGRYWRKLENGETVGKPIIFYAIKGLLAEISEKKKRAKLRLEKDKKKGG